MNLAQLFQATKSESNLLVLYIPSGDRDEKPIDQGMWVDRALHMLGTHFGGGTAFPQGKGVWRDDARGGKLIYDTPVIIQCYTNEATPGTERPGPAQLSDGSGGRDQPAGRRLRGGWRLH